TPAWRSSGSSRPACPAPIGCSPTCSPEGIRERRDETARPTRRARRRAAVPHLAGDLPHRPRRAGRRGAAGRGVDPGCLVSALDWVVLFGTLAAIVAYG